MEIPTMVDMLKSGAHFGHKKSKWHPNMGPYIFGVKQDTHVIDLEQTVKKLEEAATAAKELAAAGKTILFVGTKQQASPIIEKYAKECGMPYVHTRWLGGYLTNYANVSGVPRQLSKLKQQRESGELEKYTKKERLEFDREIEKLEPVVGGLEEVKKLPDALYVVDLKEEKTAVREAAQMNIPIIAVCDSNVDPEKAAYPIPGNDDAVKSIELFTKVIADAISEGRAAALTAATEETPAAPATKEEKK